MQFEIKSRWDGSVVYTADIDATADTPRNVALGLAVMAAVAAKADLSEADLSGAALSRAVLSRAALSRAVLSGADLSRADLRGADLRGAVLSGADLSWADLSGAALSRAVLSGADLRGADLRGAVLSEADLSGAALSRAVLSRAVLSGADLSGAAGLAYQIPQEGELIVYKKTTTGVAKLRIPPEAKRTASIVSRKCRAEFAEVIDAPNGAKSLHDGTTAYVAGVIVRPDTYNDDPRVECTNGIHFFLIREEAEAYQ